MADDYAIFRQFQMRSSLRTYLTVVIRRLFLDQRTARFGKWRPSRRALRVGSTAVLFERLTTRDGMTFDQACDALEINHRLQISRVALEGIYARSHRRPVRRFVATDPRLDEIPALTASPEERVVGAEGAALARRARATLRQAIASMPPRDRRILELRFTRGLSIADVAREMALNQKALYVRCHRLLRTLRQSLENDGIVGGEILAITGDAAWEACDVADPSGHSRLSQPFLATTIERPLIGRPRRERARPDTTPRLQRRTFVGLPVDSRAMVNRAPAENVIEVRLLSIADSRRHSGAAPAAYLEVSAPPST